MVCSLSLNYKFVAESLSKREMDPKLTEVSQLFERFKAAFIRNDLETCSKFLSQLKVMLTEFRSLPPLFEHSPNAIQELTLARTSGVGDKEWMRVFPEGKRVRTLQGDTIPATH